VRSYLITATCARLADEGARVAIVLLCLARTGSPGLGGLLVAALMVPHVIAAPLAGAAADFARRRKAVYLGAFFSYAVLITAAAFLIGPATPLAALALALAGCFAPLMIGGLRSLVGELAARGEPASAGRNRAEVAARRDRAFALDAGTYGVAGIAGPAVAAVIAGWAGATWSMLSLALLVIIGAAALATLPLQARSPERSRPSPRSLFAAFPVMARRPALGAVTVATTLYATGMGALPLVAALLATRSGHTELTGLILSVTACGGLAASLLWARFPIRRRPELVLLACVGGSALPFLAVAAVPVGWAQLPLFALAGVLGGPIGVTQFAVRDRESPREVRTQVFTLGAGLKVTGAAAGAAVAGLAAGAGMFALLVGVAVIQVLGLAAGAEVLRRGGSRHARVPAVAEYR
jgi:MFS family permease